MGPEGRDAYLRQVVELQSGVELGAVLGMRRERRGEQDLDADVPTAAGRIAAQEQLAQLRKEFWELNPNDLRQQLADADWSAFSDLERVRQRLLQVAELAEEFERAGAHEKMDQHFLEATRLALVASNAERAHLKRLAKAAILKNSLRRPAIRSVGILRTAHADIYGLEAAWFANLRGFDRARYAGTYRAYRIIHISMMVIMFLVGVALTGMLIPDG
ncbi:MAG: hypothetical protein ACI8QC_003368 [Planctomycetota bacterium]|jgi:hypothetical protein